MKPEQLDHIDTTILSELASNARASQVELAERVGLSSTAIARRQKALEEQGFIRGYRSPPLFSSGSPWKAKMRTR